MRLVHHAQSATSDLLGRGLSGDGTSVEALVLAQDVGTDIDPEEIFTEPTRPITELLSQWFGDGPGVELVGSIIDAGAQILLIMLVAWVALFLLRRAVSRLVRRASEPDAAKNQRMRAMGRVVASPSTVSARRAQRAEAMGALAHSIIGVLVWTIAVFMVLGTTFGINLAPLVAGAGIIGIAVGFGAQDLVKDFLSGVFMLVEDQYGVGDIIDVGEASGTVEGITLRTTRLRDVEGTLWHVPNGEIRRVGNSSQQWARALLDVRIGHETDIDIAIDLIEQVANTMAAEDGYRKLFLDTPEVWGVQELGPDGIDLRLVIKTEPGQQWGITRELRRRIKAACDEAGIRIPPAQHTVWFQQLPADGANDRPMHPADVPAVAERAREGDRGPHRVVAQDDEAVAKDLAQQALAEDGQDDDGTAPADR